MTRLRLLRAPALTLAFAALGAFACAPAEEPIEQEPVVEETPAPEEIGEPVPMEAVATLQDAEGNPVGTATFTQDGDQVTAVFEVTVPGASGMHGIHVHETGECTPPDFTSAGGHFNPEGVEHALPEVPTRHAGDFGNIELGEDGTGRHEVTTDLVSLGAEPDSIVGKAVILHAGRDDGTTQPTGDAGARLACGVIEGYGGGLAGAEDGMGMDDGMMDDDGTDEGTEL